MVKIEGLGNLQEILKDSSETTCRLNLDFKFKDIVQTFDENRGVKNSIQVL